LTKNNGQPQEQLAGSAPFHRFSRFDARAHWCRMPLRFLFLEFDEFRA
jgi:hypothetical protein